MKPETQLRLDIRRNVLAPRGWSTWDMEQNRRTRQTPGFSDLVAFHPDPPMIVFVELKAPQGRLSPAQKIFEQTCKEAGGTHVVWGSPEQAWNWLEANHKRVST